MIPTPADPIYYTRNGDGPPVILIHGIAASLCDWSAMMPDLAQAGYTTYALDLLGHGQSHKPENPTDYHIDAIYASFERWIEGLNLGEPLLLVAHSLGGYLSLLYTLRYPARVRGMVLIDPLYSPTQLSPWLHMLRRRPALGARVMRWVPQWLVDWTLGWDPTAQANFSPEARRQIAIDYKRASPNFVYITQDFPDLNGSLAQIEPPVMVIWGAKDLTLKPESFEQLVEILPNASAHSIAICGHQPHIGQPDLVNPATIRFLDSIRRDRQGAAWKNVDVHPTLR